MHIVNTTCSVVCMQAHRLGPENLDFHEAMMGRLIDRELQRAVNDGVSRFRVGLNMGVDIWAAKRIIHLRDAHYPHIRLHCYLPHETQANHWPETWREPYFDVQARADEVMILQSRYSRGCTRRRNLEMLRGSGLLLAVHDNVAEGGIEQAVSYAESRGIETVVIRPLEGPDVPAHLSGGPGIENSHSASRFQMLSTKSGTFSSGRSASKVAW